MGRPRPIGHATLARMRRHLLASGLLLASIASGCSYELRGRVLETGFDSVQVVAPDDVHLQEGTPVTGARLVLTRDPGKLNQSEIASAVAARDGWFTIRMEEFGGGWMEEQWGLRVARTGYGGIEELITLPFDPKKSALLITMSRGQAKPAPDDVSGSGISQDAERFWSSPGGR